MQVNIEKLTTDRFALIPQDADSVLRSLNNQRVQLERLQLEALSKMGFFTKGNRLRSALARHLPWVRAIEPPSPVAAAQALLREHVLKSEDNVFKLAVAGADSISTHTRIQALLETAESDPEDKTSLESLDHELQSRVDQDLGHQKMGYHLARHPEVEDDSLDREDVLQSARLVLQYSGPTVRVIEALLAATRQNLRKLKTSYAVVLAMRGPMEVMHKAALDLGKAADLDIKVLDGLRVSLVSAVAAAELAAQAIILGDQQRRSTDPLELQEIQKRAESLLLPTATNHLENESV